MGWVGGRWDEMRDGERGDGGVMEEGMRDGKGIEGREVRNGGWDRGVS